MKDLKHLKTFENYKLNVTENNEEKTILSPDDIKKKIDNANYYVNGKHYFSTREDIDKFAKSLNTTAEAQGDSYLRRGEHFVEVFPNVFRRW